MKIRAIALVAATLALLFLVGPAAAQEKVAGTYGQGPEVFTLATGSPGELGLLQVLGEAFAKEQGGKTSLHWIKAGSGQSLKLLKDKKVDMIMMHAPKAEKQAVQEGWATKRTLIGSNEFFIVGPPSDPAKIKEAKSAVEFVASPQGQKIIQEYGQDKYGEGLYNDAEYAQKYAH